jgi:hypothetical protein
VVPSTAIEYPQASADQVAYPTAPPGLYSRFKFQVERAYVDDPLPDGFNGDRLSVRIMGEAILQGNDRDFDYVEDQKINVDLDLDEDLPPGAIRTVTVAVDLEGWFGDVDWEELADDQGPGDDPLLIGMGNAGPVAAQLRQRGKDAFEVIE